MRKVAYVFFFILLVVAIIVIIGVNPVSFFNPSPQASHSKVDVGFVVLNQSDEFERVNFEDIISNVPYIGINLEDSTSDNTTKTKHPADPRI